MLEKFCALSVLASALKPVVQAVQSSAIPTTALTPSPPLLSSVLRI
jgi:hypothetical protein